MPKAITIDVYLADGQSFEDFDPQEVARATATAVQYQRPPEERAVDLVVVHAGPRTGEYPS